MLRILRDDREPPRTTRVEFRGIKPMNGIETVADLLSKFRLAGRFRLTNSLDRGEFLKKTFGYLKEAVGRYCGKRQDT